jgi:hypothetical protein
MAGIPYSQLLMKENSNLKMAECMAARLTAQEEQIELLTREFSLLRDGLNGGPEVASIIASSPELESLWSENEKLKFRLVHLRRGLQEELALEGQGKGGTNKGQEKKTGKEQQQPKNRNYDNNNNKVAS